MIVTPASAGTDLRASHRARIERHVAMLEEAAEISLQVVRAAGRRAALAAGAGGAEEDAAVRSFGRAARCMRQTVALEARLSEGLIKLEAGGGGDPQAAWAGEMAAAAERVREKLRQLALDEEASEDDEDESGEAPGERPERLERERLEDASEDEDFGRAGLSFPSPLAGEGGPRSGSDGGCRAVGIHKNAADHAADLTATWVSHPPSVGSADTFPRKGGRKIEHRAHPPVPGGVNPSAPGRAKPPP